MNNTQFLTNALIIIPFRFPISWPANYELQTAKHLAQHNTVIACAMHEATPLWRFILHPYRIMKRIHNLTIITPIYILPFQRNPRIQFVNHWLIAQCVRLYFAQQKKQPFSRKIFWSFSLQHALLPQWFRPQFKTIYECVDWEMEKLSLERSIIHHSDIVFTNSQVLFHKLTLLHTCVYLTPQGMYEPQKIPITARKWTKKLTPYGKFVLFAGVMNQRLDIMLITHVLRRMHKTHFIFLGPIDYNFIHTGSQEFSLNIQALSKHKNYHHLGLVSKQDVAMIISCATVCWIPYNPSNMFVTYSYPMKLLEYFAAGKPVISGKIAGIQNVTPLASNYVSADDAVNKLTSLLSQTQSSALVRAQKQFVFANSFRKKMQFINWALKKEWHLIQSNS